MQCLQGPDLVAQVAQLALQKEGEQIPVGAYASTDIARANIPDLKTVQNLLHFPQYLVAVVKVLPQR